MSNAALITVSRTQLIVTLIISIVCLVAWVLLAFVFPLGIGHVHLLLGAGVTLFMRWYALKYR